jgi:AraC family transcriptional regulator
VSSQGIEHWLEKVAAQAGVESAASTRSGDQGTFRAALWRHGPCVLSIEPSVCHAVAVDLDGAFHATAQAQGRPARSGRRDRYDFSYFPARCASRWRLDGEGRVLMLAVSDDQFAAAANALEPRGSEPMGEAPAETLPLPCGRSPMIRAVAELIAPMLANPIPYGRLALDGLGAMVAAGAFLTLCEARRLGPRRGGLTPLQKRRLHEHMAAELMREISLDELAAIAGMSRFHFARSFKESFGLSPYRYLTRLRCTAAQTMLREGSDPIASIARAVGIPHPSHFSAVFKRHAGMTPEAYRRQR